MGILNFIFPEGEYSDDSLIHEIKLKDVEDNHVFYNKLTFVYLEMPKFTKREDELETMFDKWLFALTNLSRLLERPKALQERIFTRLFEQAEIARFTPVERNEYVASKKEYWDNWSIAETAKNKGIAEGLAKGLAEGRTEGINEANREIARKMKALGMDIVLITEVTGLSKEDIQIL